jgi:uncharacterized protein YkwD
MGHLLAGLLAPAVLAFGSLTLAFGDDPKAKSDPKKEPELSKEEKEILDLTNAERKKEKLPPLELDMLLVKAARAHSANMAKTGDLNHILDGKNPGNRLDDAGYKWLEVGENISQGTDEATAEIIKLWMGSELHKANILNKDFKQIGVGIVKNAKGEVYYTQVFATPMKK